MKLAYAERIFLMLVSILMLAVIMRWAWISDDALITARSVANAVHGNGLTFNILEVVQSYTHPLWMLVQLIANSVLFDPIGWMFRLSLGTIVLLMFVVMLESWQRPLVGILALLTLVSTYGFVEWSTSGLEGPLAFLLAFITAGLAVRLIIQTSENALIESLAGFSLACLFLTRFDQLLIFLPVGLMILVTRTQLRSVFLLLASAGLPVLLWMAFSFAYYGDILPNTYWAKTNVEIPLAELFQQGFHYFAVSLERQPLILVGPMLSLIIVGLCTTGRLRIGSVLMLSGLILYYVYIASVGGDFMEGRFFVVPMVSAIGFSLVTLNKAKIQSKWWLMTISAAILFFSVIPMSSPLLTKATASPSWDWRDSSFYGVADERGEYVANGMAAGAHRAKEISEKFATWQTVSPSDVRRIEVSCWLGMKGISVGPSVHIIDKCALTDPLLARIAFVPKDGGWRVGHFYRAIPAGYRQAILSGNPECIEDPLIRRLYTKKMTQVRPEDAVFGGKCG